MAKGQSHNLCKVGNKRQRTKAQVKEDARLAILKEQEQADAMMELAMLRQRVQQAEGHLAENQASANVIKQMINDGAVQVGEDDSIIIQPSKGAKQYSASPIKPQGEQQMEGA